MNSGVHYGKRGGSMRLKLSQLLGDLGFGISGCCFLGFRVRCFFWREGVFRNSSTYGPSWHASAHLPHFNSNL